MPDRLLGAQARWGWLLVVALCLCSCAQLRRFLVPPADPTEGVRLKKSEEDKKVWADTVIVAGHLSGHPDGSVIALRRGEIVAIGPAAEVTPVQNAKTYVVRAGTGWVTTGLVDAHVHIEGSGMLGDAADLSKVQDAADLSGAVTTARATMTAWLWGFGLSRAAWDHLSPVEIDAALDDLPAYLSRADGHAAMVTDALVNLLPAQLQREVRKKGYKLEGQLARQVWRALPTWPVDRMRPLVRQTLEQMHHRGVTEVHAMGESLALLEVLYRLEAAGQLPVRVRAYLDAERPEGQALLAGKLARVNSQMVYLAGVKVWLDGTLGARSAALMAPYADEPGTSGTLLYSDAELADIVQRADKRGIHLVVHAIGDAALEQMLRVLEQTPRAPGALTVRVEHAQVVQPSQLRRIQATRVECSIQPRHAVQDAPFAAARLGPARMGWAYRGLELASWCNLRAGSDVPVTPCDPLADWRVLAKSALAGADPGQAEELAWQALGTGGSRQPARPLRVGDAVDLIVWSANPRDPAGRAVPIWSVVHGAARQIIQEQ